MLKVEDYAEHEEASVKADVKQSFYAGFSAYSSTLKMETACHSETSIYFQRTTRRYILEDGALSKGNILLSYGIRCGVVW
jgi:hypothetical protein